LEVEIKSWEENLWIIDIHIGFGTAILLCGLLVKLVDSVVGYGICNTVEKALKKVLDKFLRM
jgi:ethanolamine utilization microcompartment shell protein EutS